MLNAIRKRLTHWHHYRTAVGVLLGLGIAGAMLLLYQQQQLCDAHDSGCYVNIDLHPEDRLFPDSSQPASDVVIVGIDDKSIGELGHFPFTRDRYAQFLDTAAKDGAAVVVFDVGFTEEFTGDDAFRKSIISDRVPVVLAYGQSGLRYAPGRVAMTGQDEMPIRKLTCLDATGTGPCTRPISEVGSTALIQGEDGVARSLPMFVEPTCRAAGTCATDEINPLNFVAYRDFFLGAQAPKVQLGRTPDGAVFGQAWRRSLPVDSHGIALVNYTGAPGNFQAYHQYQSFADVYANRVDSAALKNKILLVGAYDATGLGDVKAVPTGGGRLMAGVEIHANMVSMLLKQTFISEEPGIAVALTLLVLLVGMGILLSRMSLLWGLGATIGALVVYTVAMAILSGEFAIVPDLLHVWAGIALVYIGLTAYRFLYEEREKRKVTAIFGQYVKPEIVKEMAAARSVEDLIYGGVRRDLSFLFVDIRGFTAMSEGMSADQVLRILDEYLTDLTRIIFKWDGTLDKYVGDEIMAIWNAPHEQADHAIRAVRCACDMVAHARELRAKLRSKGLPEIAYGIGVNTGQAVVGSMGSKLRLQYTAIGDTVNTGARFCSAAGPLEVLIGHNTLKEVGDLVDVEQVSGLQLKGKTAETFRVYRVRAFREKSDQPWQTLEAPAPTAEPAAEVAGAGKVQVT